MTQWKPVTLGDISVINTGARNNQDKATNGKYPFFVRSPKVERINSYSYDGEAILVPGEGNIGKIFHYINGQFDYHQRVYKISDFSKNTIGKFIYYVFLVDFARQAKNNSVKATVDSLRLPTFKKFKLLLPPIEEQKRIATVLETWDEYLEKLDEKIALKEQLKKGLMQQLLTGKKRLPGFSGEWLNVKLGDIADFQNGYTFKSSFYDYEGSFKVITISHVQDGKLNTIGAKRIKELPSDINNEQVLKEDDILISMTGNVGRVCLVDEDKCLLNQRVGKISAKKGTNKYFIYYMLMRRQFLYKMIYLSQGGAQSNVSSKDIMKYTVQIPGNTEEQNEIALILKKIDAEINMLHKKKKSLKKQRLYLLNNLVTGKIRTPENLKTKEEVHV